MSDDMIGIEEIDKEIERLQELKEQKEIELEIMGIKDKSKYTKEEKCQFFDKCFDFAMEQLHYIKENHEDPKEMQYDAFETLLEGTLGKDIWGLWNSFY